MRLNKIYTIGVYGTTEDSFFNALTSASVDMFCDIRRHRGMRGSTYAYANSTYLQKKLKTLGIKYAHYLPLAPTQEMRQLQKMVDRQTNTSKRKRQELSEAFKTTYQTEVLDSLDLSHFMKLAESYENVCLFCVECLPESCHRSLAAIRLSSLFNLTIHHLMPCQQNGC